MQAFILDKASILERLGGDEEIYAMMVDMYRQDVEANCASLAKAFASGDADQVRREAHTIKGLLATFSDDPGAAEALMVERQARDVGIDGLGASIDALQERLREVSAVLGATS